MIWVGDCMGEWMIEWLNVLIKGCCWSPDDAYLERLRRRMSSSHTLNDYTYLFLYLLMMRMMIS